MASMDEVDLNTIFARRANVMSSILHFLKGPCRAAVRLAMREASCAREIGDVLRLTRAWKLFLLLPRMFLSRPPRGGLVSKTRLLERVSLFHNGQWSDLVEPSAVEAEDSPFCGVQKETSSQVGGRTPRKSRTPLCVGRRIVLREQRWPMGLRRLSTHFASDDPQNLETPCQTGLRTTCLTIQSRWTQISSLVLRARQQSICARCSRVEQTLNCDIV